MNLVLCSHSPTRKFLLARLVHYCYNGVCVLQKSIQQDHYDTD